ncbi:lipopolysaccharide transport periplasmic protein LptA [Zeimonas arvi]|uniref:Lipopolysaccharide export system protein LptA n=1 Tax=Zeimonas arvi TaxID=2498847 RepID=A0A5C8NWU6_9BURK|nr:lipopolysaccharide transport periplasmic protein LptA [Zeimonas arvi]TXL65470.1 lipopolysaccharide transport periplasmic protein LptA [Zeimonas arvi]
MTRPATPLTHSRFPAALTATAFVAAIALSGWTAPARAEKADRDQPLAVESDQMQYDDIKQVGTFTGRVVLTKGSIVVRADRLTVRQDEEGWQHATAWGAPATFRQKREGVNEWIEGRARRIDYDGKHETVRLQQQATMQRTDGARILDEIHGNDILYESGTELFSVQGAAGKEATPENPSGRVRMVIQPRTANGQSPGEPAPLKPADRLAPGSR